MQTFFMFSSYKRTETNNLFKGDENSCLNNVLLPTLLMEEHCSALVHLIGGYFMPNNAPNNIVENIEQCGQQRII